MKKFLTFFIAFCLSVPTFSQPPNAPLQIFHLTGDFYVYTTYKNMGGSPFPSNSMYLVTDKGVVMFDTPWDSTQFQPLMDSIEATHHQPVVLCIATHFHDDRTIGLDFLKQKGVATYASKLTNTLAPLHGDKQAEYTFTKDTTFTVGDYSFETYFPGEGHTRDNIVIWFAKQKILYGGCFIKSTENTDIGYVADANVAAWPTSVKNAMNKCRDAKYVIPGHFSWASNKGLEHTLKLLQQYNKDKKP